MPSGIIRARVTSCCSLVIRISAASRSLFNAGSDWVGSCAITIKRRRDRTPNCSIPELRFCALQLGRREVAEAALLPLAPTLRSGKLDRSVKYRFFRRYNFLAIRVQHMPKLRVHNFSISLDGYGAGPIQDQTNPLGVGGEELHDWFVATRTFQKMTGKKGGTTGTDDDFAARGFKNIGACILGRNMFGPERGPWPDDSWKGWWGSNPPYHTPVFVLTHHPRASIPMEGGTTFHFVTDGIQTALRRATEVAKDQDN